MQDASQINQWDLLILYHFLKAVFQPTIFLFETIQKEKLTIEQKFDYYQLMKTDAKTRASPMN